MDIGEPFLVEAKMSKATENNDRSLILHIGQTKTATTSLQHFLTENRTVLRESNIDFADAPASHISHRYLFHLINAEVSERKAQRHHHCDRLSTFLIDPHLVQWDHENPEALIKYFWNFFYESLQSTHKIVLISEELLWHIGEFETHQRIKALTCLRDKLQPILENRKLIITAVLRHHSEWLESWHNQMVKDQANQQPLAVFLNKQESSDSLRFRQILNDWTIVFPNATIKVIDFRGGIVSPYPLGIMFFRSFGFLDQLNKGTLQNLIHPKSLQESIHPLLHAYLIRRKPLISEISSYKKAIRKANMMTKLILEEINLDKPYTLLSPEIQDRCIKLYDSDQLDTYAINHLQENISQKKQVPKKLPKKLVEALGFIFNP